MAAENSTKAAPGTPFPPGVTGNAGGVPAWVREMRELARSHCPEAIEKLAQLMRNGRSERIQREAAEALLDRAGLKAIAFEPDKLALTDEHGNGIAGEITVRFVRPSDGGDSRG